MDVENTFIDENLKKVFDATPVAMVLSDLKGKFEYVNPALLKMLGYTRDEIYQKDVIISHPDDIPLSNKVRQQLCSSPFSPIVVEKRYLHKSGKVVPGMLTMVAQPDEFGGVKRFIAQIVDLTKIKQAEESLVLFRSLVNHSNDCIFVIDPKTSMFLDANKKACESLGYSYDELLTRGVIDIEDIMPDNGCWQQHVKEMRSCHGKMIEGVHRRKDGSRYPVEISVSHVEQEHSEHIVAIARDISERKATEELIWRQANFDSLTQLPNRSLLHDRLLLAIKKARRSGQRIALLSLDLDHFKDVNDTFGHAFGDQLLIETGRRLRECVRESDTVARMGGDEFTIVMADLEVNSCIEHTVNSILNKLAAPFFCGANHAYISASIGVTFYPKDGVDVDALLLHGDQAMYSAKSSGRNRHQYFTKSLQEYTDAKLWLSRALREAVINNEFNLVYQPIVKLNTGSIHRVEALLRWNHPVRGFISPEKFIPIAEENGTMLDIGEWVFKQAAQQVKIWREKFHSQFQVSINVSPVQFRNFSHQLFKWSSDLKQLGTTGDAVIIEITEGVLMDLDMGVKDVLLYMRQAGMSVAIDDFGTGYSSLSYLKKMEVDYLKIDRSFVKNLVEKQDNMALCEAIIVMAHKLNVQVIAEGVESQEQEEVLKAAGCDYAQGFYYSQGISPKECEALFTVNRVD